MNLQPTHLENNLIKLVPLGPGDFERLYAIAADPLIWEQHPERERYKREVFQGFFDGALASDSAFLIFDAQTNNLIGSTRYYDYDEDKKEIAIGYTFLARSHWGGTHNRALKELMINYAFQYVGIIIFHIGGGNIRSQMAVQKLGGKKIAEADGKEPGNVEQMKFTFALNKEDWNRQV